MNPNKVVVKKVKRHHVAVIFQFLTESICQPRKAAHPIRIDKLLRSTNDVLM